MSSPEERRLDGRRIALIGGAGFIGHNMALRMRELGAHVEVIDGLEVNNIVHYSALSPDEPYRALYLKILYERLDLLHAAGVPLRRLDARDYHGLSIALGEIQPDTVVQLAAVAHANRSNKDPFSTFDHSMRTLENALDWSRNQGLERFVFFSSSMVYGNFVTPEADEDHPLDPIGIYGALKLAGERLVIAYNQVFGLPYTIVRPSALYGPRCVSRRVGQAFIESALVGSKLRVDGEGEERVDFTYIDDVVDGVIAAIVHEGGRDEVFNMTAGKGRSLRELVTLVQEHFPEIEVEYVERDALRPFRGTLAMGKAERVLGFKPSVELEDGLTRYVEWYRELTREGLPVSAVG
ncbi:MAG TPA: NAD-dependent epimerase/dehydratase family protein [Solirubrobacteraceae bacterium]|jgi:nucleoside-diphosphate-sugar epimerase|nr:NAD-dependent epimerase/dehydratase family protein [Solirubrobacteraceae bacterium]